MFHEKEAKPSPRGELNISTMTSVKFQKVREEFHRHRATPALVRQWHCQSSRGSVDSNVLSSTRAVCRMRSTRLYSSRDRIDSMRGDQKKKPGDRLGSLVTSTENPLDLMSFVPRLTLGALFSTMEDGIRLAQSDIERITMILSDDTIEEGEKQTQLLLELEDRVTGFVKKGIEKENEVVDTLKRAVPEEIQGALPEQVKSLLFERRIFMEEENGVRGTPLATWTISEEDVIVTSSNGSTQNAGFSQTNGAIYTRDGGEEEEETFVPSPEATARGQAAAELMDIQSSVMVLKENIEALKSNTDESKNGMLKLNVREASQSLSQRIEQRSMSSKNSGNPDIDAALVEAKELLQEVNSLLL